MLRHRKTELALVNFPRFILGTGKHEASFQAFRGHFKQTRPRTKPKMAGRLGREGSTKFIRQIGTVITPAGKLGPRDAKHAPQSTQRTRF